MGYRLDEIRNDITRKTPACFEPTIDYVVAKIPKWAFEKFPGADATLGTQMKSVGEVMAIGRTFKEALSKGMRSLETGKAFGSEKFDKSLIAQKLITPTPDRLNYIRFAMANGYSVEEIHELTIHRPVVPGADEGSGGFRSLAGARPTGARRRPRLSAAPSATASPTCNSPRPGAPTKSPCATAARSWA